MYVFNTLGTLILTLALFLISAIQLKVSPLLPHVELSEKKSLTNSIPNPIPRHSARYISGVRQSGRHYIRARL